MFGAAAGFGYMGISGRIRSDISLTSCTIALEPIPNTDNVQVYYNQYWSDNTTSYCQGAVCSVFATSGPDICPTSCNTSDSTYINSCPDNYSHANVNRSAMILGFVFFGVFIGLGLLFIVLFALMIKYDDGSGCSIC